MKIHPHILVVLMSLLTVSCASPAPVPDRDPASQAEVCFPTSRKTNRLEDLNSQALARLQTAEADLPHLESLYLRWVAVITKSRLYSTGLSTDEDPRLTVINHALAIGGGPDWRERLYALRPDLRPTPSDDQIQSTASALINKGRVEEARSRLMALSEKSDAPLELRLAARLDYLKTFRFQGSDALFLTKLESDREWHARTFESQRSPSAKAVASSSSYRQALIRAHVRAGRLGLALKETKRLRSFLSSHQASTADADWMQGRLFELKGDLAKALASYEGAARALPADGFTRDQIAWQVGWLNYKLRRFANAEQIWMQLGTDGPAQVLARNQFWIAKARQARGLSNESRVLFTSIQEMYPGTFYAPLASRELGSLIQPISSPENFCELAKRVVTRLQAKYGAQDIEGFIALLQRGDRKRTQQFLMDLSVSEGLDSSLYLASALSGDYQPLIIGFSKLPLAEQKILVDSFPQLLFPNPYRALVAKASAQSGVDPYLPLSVIRQESVFAPFSLSYADARGLMQVIASEGEKYSKQLNVAAYSLDRLYEPELNIAIGTALLRHNLDKNRGSHILTLAAYNAGEDITELWRQRLSKDPLEFIEDIPFQETNGYVKAILRNEIYNRALTESAPFPFPESLLKR